METIFELIKGEEREEMLKDMSKYQRIGNRYRKSK